MRTWLTVSLILALALPAYSQAANQPATKSASYGVSRPPTAAETAAALSGGGENFADAIPISATPFTDNGTTLGYANDYDDVCVVGDPDGAPDVVYAFTAPATGYYDFNLCGSAYDTKLYIYEVHASLLACNDDYDPYAPGSDPCYLTSRIVDFPCTAGQLYYVVVDGFQGLAGDYTLNVDSCSHCGVTAPQGAMVENEPPLAAVPVDAFNCGCQCAGDAIYQEVTGDGTGQAVVSLVQGWRGFGDRDQDWFQLTAGASGNVHIDFEGEVATTVLVALSTDCGTMDATVYDTAACTTLAIDANVGPGAVFAIAVQPLGYRAPFGVTPVEYSAVLSVTGLASGVPLESTTWGAVKILYR